MQFGPATFITLLIAGILLVLGVLVLSTSSARRQRQSRAACRHCGHANPDGAAYCAHCGHELG